MTTIHKIKFINSIRLMSSIYQVLLTIFLNGFTMITAHLEYISDKDELLIFNCLKSSKNHKKHFNKYLIKRFANTYEFCDGDKKILFNVKKGRLCTRVHG